MISDDLKLGTLLNEPSLEMEEDKHLCSIIYEGRNDKIDHIIFHIQSALKQKRPMVPYANLGGADGMRVTRAAFAVMVKFSDKLDDL